MTYQESYNKWLASDQLPDYLRQELEGMDETTKEDALFSRINPPI